VTKQDLQTQLTQAIKDQDETRKSTLRMLLSAISYFEIQKGGAGYTASSEDIETVVQSEVKKHKDSIEQYRMAKREDLASKEEAELKILNQFMPEQLSEEELVKFVDEAIAKTGAKEKSQMGLVMSALMPMIKGKADGQAASKIVLAKLG